MTNGKSANGQQKRDAKTRVLIIGGGFAGTYAALEFDKRLARRDDVEVTLIDRQNFMLFTPMLHEVAASDLEITTIVSPIRQLLKHVYFLSGKVTAIDLNEKTVMVTHLSDCEQDTLGYDYLLIAAGAHPNFYGLPGLKENAFTMNSLRDAVYLRNAMIESLEEAEFDASTKRQKPLLTYVAVGGGFAGVETVAAMNDFVRESIRFYPHLQEEMVRVVLVHDGSYILPELGEELGTYALEKLKERKVECMLGKRVKGYGEKGVELSDGETIKSVLFVWTAGVTGSDLVKNLGAKLERGRLLVDQFMEVPGFAGVFACGDCAYITDPSTGKPYPPTAQHASRQAVVVARNIEAAISGGSKHQFQYKMLGQLAAIGRRTGVAKIMGVKFSGILAWMLWRTIYLMKLPRLEKKIRVMFDWTLDLIFSKDLVQFISLDSPLVQNDTGEDGDDSMGTEAGDVRHRQVEPESEHATARPPG